MQPIDIQMPEKVYKKVMWFIDKSPVEISLLGNVVNRDGSLIITDVFLPEQTNSACETEMKPESIADLMYKTKDIDGSLNCWIHSHVNMGVQWSGTDIATIEQIGSAGYCLAIVLNKREEYTCAYYQNGDGFRASVFMDELDFTVTSNTPAKHIETWEKLYKARCHKPVYKAPTFPHTHRYGAVNIPPVPKNLKQAMLNLPSVKQVEDKMLFDGMIHPSANNLRYSDELEKFITYAAYVAEDKNHDENLMDQFMLRSEYIDKYTQEKGVRPDDDYEVNDFFMEDTGTGFYDFYTEVDPTEEEAPQPITRKVQ